MNYYAILDEFFSPTKAQSTKISRMSKASEIPKFHKPHVTKNPHVPIAKIGESKFLADYNAKTLTQPMKIPKRQ